MTVDNHEMIVGLDDTTADRHCMTADCHNKIVDSLDTAANSDNRTLY